MYPRHEIFKKLLQHYWINFKSWINNLLYSSFVFYYPKIWQFVRLVLFCTIFYFITLNNLIGFAFYDKNANSPQVQTNCFWCPVWAIILYRFYQLRLVQCCLVCGACPSVCRRPSYWTQLFTLFEFFRIKSEKMIVVARDKIVTKNSRSD